MSAPAQRPVRYFTVDVFEAGFELGLALTEFADVVLTAQDGQQHAVVMSAAAFEERSAALRLAETAGGRS